MGETFITYPRPAGVCVYRWLSWVDGQCSSLAGGPAGAYTVVLLPPTELCCSQERAVDPSLVSWRGHASGGAESLSPGAPRHPPPALLLSVCLTVP